MDWGRGHKMCKCQKFRNVIQDLVDKKAISFEKPNEERKTPIQVDNKKLGIYKNPMPQHNTGILLMQEHTTKGVGIPKAQSDKQ